MTVLTKRSIIVGLVGVNLFLLAALVLSAAPPPAAMAQTAGRPGDFMMISCQFTDQYDALYILDNPGRLLHCFAPAGKSAGKMIHAQTRELINDFRLPPR
jgi:hypothetical protein